MPNLKCEYPNIMSIESDVIISRYIANNSNLLDINFVVPASQVGGKVTDIRNVMVNLIEAKGVIHSVEITIDYQIIMTVMIGTEFQVVTLEDVYEQVIDSRDFDPPLTPQELRTLAQNVQVIVTNWSFNYDILGNSEDPSNPCNLTSPVIGTCISLQVNADLSVLLTRVNDIVVFGELDPDIPI